MSNDTQSTPTLLDFDFYNSDEEQVIFVTDDVAGELMHLEVVNTSGVALSPAFLEGPISETSHHFELVFRPGTLYNNPAAIQLESSQFDMYSAKDDTGKIIPNPDGTLSLYFRSPADWTLQPGEKVTLKLNHVRAETGTGTRGSRLLLNYRNLLPAGSSDAITGNKQLPIGIVNRTGRRNIPLQVSFIGPNAILNNGEQPNRLRLRIANSSRRDQLIAAGENSRIILAVEGGPIEEEWTLATDGQLNGMKVSVTYPNNQSVEVGRAPDKNEWEFPFQQLANREFIDIQLENLVTSHDTGYSTLFLYYENIPGYWDGEITAPVAKQPLVFEQKNVGVGTIPKEGQEFVVDGDALIQNGTLQVLNKNQDNQGQCLTLGPIDKTNLRLGYNEGYSWIQAQGLKPLSINAAGNNVGIHTTAPKESLDVNGTAKCNYLKVGKTNIGDSHSEVHGWINILHQNQDSGGGSLVLGPTSQSNLRLGYNSGYSWIQSHGSKPLAINAFGNNVGIRTDAPQEPLDVAGTVKCSALRIGNTTITENDLHILRKLAAGTLQVDIWNTKQQEYMYAGDYAPYDNDRRRVFTWRPKTRVNQGQWILKHPY